MIALCLICGAALDAAGMCGCPCTRCHPEPPDPMDGAYMDDESQRALEVLANRGADMKDLAYHGRMMAWKPTRVQCMKPSRVLVPEPPDHLDLRMLLHDGYSIVVELQPGDATMYGLVLSPTPDGAVAVRVGIASPGACVLRWGSKVDFADAVAIAGGNVWSAEFLAWWLTRLTEVEHP